MNKTTAEQLKVFKGESRLWRAGRPLSEQEYREQLARRFWTKVDKTPGHGPKGDCWLWVGCLDLQGYGQICYRFSNGTKRPIKSHRVAYLLTHGDFPPENKEVCHSCDNPPCVNPNHLFAGTHKRNMYDAIAKGRLPFNPEKRNKVRQRRIKFTPEQQAIIKAARKEKGLSIYDMGQVLGVDYTRYFRMETDEPSCTFEQYHFLLRYLNIDEQSLNVTSDQFYEKGRIGVRPGFARTKPHRVKVFKTQPFQRTRPHVFWDRLNTSTENYRADLIVERLKHSNVSAQRVYKELGICQATFRTILEGNAAILRHLIAVTEYAGLTMKDIFTFESEAEQAA